MSRIDLEVARRKMREAARVLQRRFEEFAGEAGGARVWQERPFDETLPHLCALVWSDREDWDGLGWGVKYREVSKYVICFPEAKAFCEYFSGDNAENLECLTTDQYKDRYFFNHLPFCHPKMG